MKPINLNTVVKTCTNIEAGDVVLDIYTFMRFYLNPYHHKNKKYLHTVKSSNSKHFSVYKDTIPSFWSGSDSYNYNKKDTERTIQQILDKVNDPYNRSDVYINIENIEIINFFIENLFAEKISEIENAEISQIQKYKNEIKILKKKIKVIEEFGMINEINKNIFDRKFVEKQKDVISTELNKFLKNS